jgi:hypothetical protein
MNGQSVSALEWSFKIEVGEAHMDKPKETFSSIEMKLKS